MHTHTKRIQKNENQSVTSTIAQTKSGNKSYFQLADNRPEAITQRKLQNISNNSPRVTQLKAFQNTIKYKYSSQHKQPIQKKESDTGLPNDLKTGIEHLSGYSMDDVKVHRNSGKPAQLQAHAYAQGTDIYLGPGQEKHLAHEAWHVIQQKQGRVRPTLQMKGIININDDIGLEKEADVMGEKAMQMSTKSQRQISSPVQMITHSNIPVSQLVIQAKLKSDVLNVAGETHTDYDPPNAHLRDKEKTLAQRHAGGGYWTEDEFKVTEDSLWYGKQKDESGDPVLYQFLQNIELINSIGGEHISKMNPQKQDEAKFLYSLVENVARVIGGGVQARYKTMIDEFKKGYLNLTNEQKDAAQKMAPKLANMTLKCIQIHGGIKNDGTLIKSVQEISSLQADCDLLNSEIKHLGNILNKQKPVTQEGVRVTRSKEMHFSAQASHKTKGIWKVGNNHYNDIAKYVKGFFVKASNYNLLSKDEFNDERDKFTP